MRRHIARNRLVAYALEHHLDVPFGSLIVPDAEEDADQLGDQAAGEITTGDDASRYAALREASPARIVWRRPELFTARLLADLGADTAALQHLLNSYGPWTPDRDSKLQKLIQLVTVDHPHDKILIFTEYTDTADYLASQLTAAGIDKVGVVTGGTDDPIGVATRFSPHSNEKIAEDGRNLHAIAPEDELRILVATDVVSEGQNLQDAHIVVNYDLPWAIIRLIQRAGRVDRFGQKSDTVLVYSMFHDSLEQVISLRQRIAHRLADNAAVFGSDEGFFGAADEVAVITDLYNGTLDEASGDSDDDVDAGSLAYQYWTRAVEADEALSRTIPSLPPLIDATRPARPEDRHAGTVCYVRTASGLDGYGFTGPDMPPRILSGHEAIRAFAAEPATPSLPREPGHDDRVKELAHGVLATPDAVDGLHGVRLRVWRRLTGDQDALTGLDWDEDTKRALDDLHTHSLTKTAEESLRRGLRDHLTDDQLAARLASLWRDGDLIFTSAQNSTLQIITSMGITA
ncbi:C-terminal helicase domain-containing protein [Propionibacterium sp.]|uniref:C-terminal helicase domain-containing protein n=1 Tax=Propionibacterium sp. TaxID=1977903 RepID=UPI0039E9D0C6